VKLTLELSINNEKTNVTKIKNKKGGNMKENLTWIVFVLDESGSMADIKSDTIGAFNNFIKEQRKVEGLADCTLVKFNTKIEKVYENQSIQEAPLLDDNSYKPTTWTRLYDAIGQTIKQVKDNIKETHEDEKPSKVLFVILTDGKENRSTEFNKKDVLEKIKKREAKGWNFIYLGANQDAMEEGGKIGIGKMNTVTWSADSKGINTAFMSASNYAAKYRSAKSPEEIASLDLNQEYKDVGKNL
jgi:uncharacterized protein YegL